jgi:hypothetical protein
MRANRLRLDEAGLSPDALYREGIKLDAEEYWPYLEMKK